MQELNRGWCEKPLQFGVRANIDPGYRCSVPSYLQLCQYAFPTIMAAPLNLGACPSWSFFSQLFEHQNEKSNWPTSIRSFHLLSLEAGLCVVTEPPHAMATQHQAPLPGPHVKGEATQVRSPPSTPSSGHFVSSGSALSGRLSFLCLFLYANIFEALPKGLRQTLLFSRNFMLGTVTDYMAASMDTVLGKDQS